MAELSGKRLAILVASGSDQIEMTVARQVLMDAGADTVLMSVKKHEVRCWRNVDWGDTFAVDLAVVEARAGHFHGLLIPGGLIGADTLRADTHVVRLVRDALDRGEPVAALGHAPWVLVEAGAVKDRLVTSIETVRTDLENAGGRWVDQPVAIDGPVVTGRNRHDMPDFIATFVECLVGRPPLH